MVLMSRLFKVPEIEIEKKIVGQLRIFKFGQKEKEIICPFEIS